MANIVERQTELSKSLYEINSGTIKGLAELQRENLEKYFETNKTFGERLPEVKSVSDFLELQREYGQTLWTNARTAFESQNEIVRSAIEDTTEAFKDAFKVEAEEAPKPKKAKAKAKKPAKEAA
jgi:hypothetical protein